MPRIMGGSQLTKTLKAPRAITPFAPCAMTSTRCRPVWRPSVVPIVRVVVPEPGDAMVVGLNANVSPGGPDALNVTSEANVSLPNVVRLNAALSPLLICVTADGVLRLRAGAGGVVGVVGV